MVMHYTNLHFDLTLTFQLPSIVVKKLRKTRVFRSACQAAGNYVSLIFLPFAFAIFLLHLVLLACDANMNDRRRFHIQWISLSQIRPPHVGFLQL